MLCPGLVGTPLAVTHLGSNTKSRPTSPPLAHWSCFALGWLGRRSPSLTWAVTIDFDPLPVVSVQTDVWKVLSLAAAAAAVGTLPVPFVDAISVPTLAAISQFLGRLSGHLDVGPVDLSYNVAGVALNSGYGLEQSVSFHPESVGVTIEFA